MLAWGLREPLRQYQTAAELSLEHRACMHPPHPTHCPQSRPNIFDLEVRCPEVLYERVVECDEQVVLPLGPVPGT